MKIVGIAYKKRPSNGTGVYRVTVKYTIGTRGQKVYTANMAYNWFNGTCYFVDEREEASNRWAKDSLRDFVESYFKLKFYGWEA